MTAFHAYLFGVWTMMGVIFVYQIINERRRKRRQRAYLEIQLKIFGAKPKLGETNAELQQRLRSLLRGPFR